MGFDKSLQSEFIIPVSDTQAINNLATQLQYPLLSQLLEYMTPFIKENIILNIIKMQDGSLILLRLKS
ncbi:MAG: hypothetical protein CM15mP29_4190 [Alphaproteobacteria bacterium]|nr:MAG: hypothetical protein CM15mP29_4190 [Alphaproteobacteria bacterium]